MSTNESDIDAFTKSAGVKVVDILVYVTDKEYVTTDDVVRHFGFAPTTAKCYLRQLAESGFLIAVGGSWLFVCCLRW